MLWKRRAMQGSRSQTLPVTTGTMAWPTIITITTTARNSTRARTLTTAPLPGGGGGGVVKVRILSHGAGWYAMALPAGTRRSDVRPSRLAMLMELTSKELSNQRQRDGEGKGLGTLNVETQHGPRSQSRPHNRSRSWPRPESPTKTGPTHNNIHAGPAGAWSQGRRVQQLRQLGAHPQDTTVAPGATAGPVYAAPQ